MTRTVVDVLIVGAGQAGLALGYYLKQSNCSFVLIDAAARVGDTWRKRYDSLVLFSPRSYSRLPGLALSGDPKGFPSKDELADYLETYARHFSIPVHVNTKAKRLEKLDDLFKIATSHGEYIAQKVVIATGPFQKPFIPKLKGPGSNRIFQIHSSQYQNPSQLHGESVLIIGGGNSGVQIAAELSETRKVTLSIGHELIFIPHRILGRSIFWWLDKTRLSRASVDSKLAKFLQKTEPIIGMDLKHLIENGKVEMKERAISCYEQDVAFKDGSSMNVETIIWATGYHFDFSWIDIHDVLDNQHKPIHQKGVSPVKGIYFIGLPWLSRVGSAQLNGVDHDAKHLFQIIMNQKHDPM